MGRLAVTYFRAFARAIRTSIGVTRESVNKNLGEWSRSGFIKHDRDYLEILDLDAPRAIAERR